MRNLILGLGIVAVTAGAAWAKPPLRDVRVVDDAVFDVAVADKIRKQCPEISARVVKALSLYRSVRKTARNMGYSDDEIEAYGDSKPRRRGCAQKARHICALRGLSLATPKAIAR